MSNNRESEAGHDRKHGSGWVREVFVSSQVAESCCIVSPGYDKEQVLVGVTP